MPEFHEIGRQPAQEYPEAIDVGEIGAHDRPHVGRAQERSPWHAGLLRDVWPINVTRRVRATDVGEFGFVDQSVLFRKITIGEIP